MLPTEDFGLATLRGSERHSHVSHLRRFTPTAICLHQLQASRLNWCVPTPGRPSDSESKVPNHTSKRSVKHPA
eukprot:460626-Prymnesium_polylepis.1